MAEWYDDQERFIRAEDGCEDLSRLTNKERCWVDWIVASQMTQQFLSEIKQHYEEDLDDLENSVNYNSAIY